MNNNINNTTNNNINIINDMNNNNKIYFKLIFILINLKYKVVSN